MRKATLISTLSYLGTTFFFLLDMKNPLASRTRRCSGGDYLHTTNRGMGVNSINKRYELTLNYKQN